MSWVYRQLVEALLGDLSIGALSHGPQVVAGHAKLINALCKGGTQDPHAIPVMAMLLAKGTVCGTKGCIPVGGHKLQQHRIQ